MDGQRFDDLARHFARRLSRRSVLKGAGGGLAAGVVAIAATRETDAYICRTAGVLCAKDAHCCSRQCDTGNTWRCIGCGDDLVECSGQCVDTESDPNNCGGCAGSGGEVCETGESCRDGLCCTPCGPVECCTADQYCNQDVCFPLYYG